MLRFLVFLASLFIVLYGIRQVGKLLFTIKQSSLQKPPKRNIKSTSLEKCKVCDAYVPMEMKQSCGKKQCPYGK